MPNNDKLAKRIQQDAARQQRFRATRTQITCWTTDRDALAALEKLVAMHGSKRAAIEWALKTAVLK